MNFLSFAKAIVQTFVLFLVCPVDYKVTFLKWMRKSKSQLGQDLFVLSQLGFKRDGYFVEFGACDGVYLSNSLLVESEFGWSGILSEPGRIWHDDLAKNRTDIIDHRCVYSSSGNVVIFSEMKDAGLSTMDGFVDSDSHFGARKKKVRYEVGTITLLDLLKAHHAPKTIDFLSIDTEGSEFAILNAFDFSSFSFRVICVEHNYTESRGLIYDLLTSNGYVRKFPLLSRFDDWYVLVQ